MYFLHVSVAAFLLVTGREVWANQDDGCSPPANLSVPNGRLVISTNAEGRVPVGSGARLVCDPGFYPEVENYTCILQTGWDTPIDHPSKPLPTCLVAPTTPPTSFEINTEDLLSGNKVQVPGGSVVLNSRGALLFTFDEPRQLEEIVLQAFVPLEVVPAGVPTQEIQASPHMPATITGASMVTKLILQKPLNPDGSRDPILPEDIISVLVETSPVAPDAPGIEPSGTTPPPPPPQCEANRFTASISPFSHTCIWKVYSASTSDRANSHCDRWHNDTFQIRPRSAVENRFVHNLAKSIDNIFTPDSYTNWAPHEDLFDQRNSCAYMEKVETKDNSITRTGYWHAFPCDFGRFYFCYEGNVQSQGSCPGIRPDGIANFKVNVEPNAYSTPEESLAQPHGIGVEATLTCDPGLRPLKATYTCQPNLQWDAEPGCTDAHCNFLTGNETCLSAFGPPGLSEQQNIADPTVAGKSGKEQCCDHYKEDSECTVFTYMELAGRDPSCTTYDDTYSFTAYSVPNCFSGYVVKSADEGVCDVLHNNETVGEFIYIHPIHNGKVYGGMAYPSCFGKMNNLKSAYRCMPNNEWDFPFLPTSVPGCVPYDDTGSCPMLANQTIPNGALRYSFIRKGNGMPEPRIPIGEVATLYCGGGYKAEKEMYLCQRGGTWDSPLTPKCELDCIGGICG